MEYSPKGGAERGLSAPADTITDGKPRYSVRRTGTEDTKDLRKKTADLKDPDNLKTEVIYDEKDNTYSIGTSLSESEGGTGTSGTRGTRDTGSKGSSTSRNASTSGRSGSGSRGGNTSSQSSSQTGAAGASSGSLLPGRSGFTLGTATSFLNAPVLMTPEEYQEWSLQNSMQQYWRQKNAEAFEAEGKNKFDFTDMHFDLGPAEKIFGPGGVQIKTQGSAELKMGINSKKVNNPALAASRRKTVGFDFDEKINLSLNGKVGDKINMNLNYNTQATFDYDAQNLKLKYDGKEDEIVKLIEAGNVSFPSNVGLVPGVSSLFGLRTDVQFGKLKIQSVISQKKSASSSVNSKGGSQTTNFEFSATNYEENRHFFLSHFFREKFDQAMATLPTISSGINIKRVEIWVTNKSGRTENNRNIIALADLGEPTYIYNPIWTGTGTSVPNNRSNSMYDILVNNYADARDISQATSILDGIEKFYGSVDYEKLQAARKLTTSEYTVNNALGYVSLSSTLQVDDVLAVAYEYTYMGTTYQVGEFASDITDNSKALFVKLLKGTSGSPNLPTWRLMMKNVYYLGTQKVMADKFRLDIKYQSDSTGVYLSYLPEEKFKSTILLRALNLDRLDAKNNPHPNGQFDFVEGYTISKGRIIFPVAEPFGEHLAKWINDPALADKYCFRELYDSTKTVAKQITEHDKFLLTGRYKGTNAGEIDLGVTNVAKGSVIVTAGGTTLTENVDYTVDYNMGRVTIINQSLIDSGTNISASVESNDTYGMQRKTMVGLNLDYQINKNFTVGGTVMHLSEQPLTTKVSMGNEPLKNTIWGLHVSWKKESQWLTNLIDKLPLIQCTQPSMITFNGEFAQLLAGQNHSVQGDASYLDDFESSSIKSSLTQPTYWSMSSTPSMFAESKLSADAAYGYNRALLAWYYVDPIFTRRSSTLTPSHIKSDLDQLSSHYVREVYERELYPQKSQNNYTSATGLSVLNLAFYPRERGAYNLSTDVDQNGHLNHPEEMWGGMMRKLDNTDFEAQNIEYIEFWMMDPFIYKHDQPGNHGGDLYFNLGEVSEDILKDGKKYFESGMPVDGNPQYFTEGYWGRIPNSSSVTYAFNNEAGARARQDVGLNGLNDDEEREFELYANYLQQIQSKVSGAVFDSIYADPANDNYHYYRGSDFDQLQTSILNRYKRINMPQGNSADSDTRPESYETAWKVTPDVEDINQDFTLNEYEKYYQYRVSIRPEDMVVGRNHIADKRTASVKLRNGNTEECTWYLFRIPLREYEDKEGNIRDFTSIRFMRIFMTGFEEDIILRLATLDLVQGDWRTYQQPLYNGTVASTGSGTLEVSTVCIEENNDKQPVNYVLPPGITRITDPSQSQLVEANEQAMCMVARNLGGSEAKAVYKNCNYDMRQYKHLQMYVHANALAENITATTDGECSVFIRLGSDYKSNYYEYEVPLKLTPEGNYDTYSAAGCLAVWPAENMVDIDFDLFTSLKKQRNAQASIGATSMNRLFSTYDENNPNNRISIMGNPTLGEVKTIMIGIRNNSGKTKSIEVWANELRLQEFSNNGGWAAQGSLQVQLSDLGSVNATAKMITSGFGGIEQSVAQRKNEDNLNYSVSTQFDLGRLLPEKAKLHVPVYYSYSKEKVAPKYNPFDTDMLLGDAIDALAERHQKDSLRSLTTHTETNRNLSFSGVRLNISTPKHPMPYDPANFTFGYSRSRQNTEGQTTVYERDLNWKASINYSWSPNWKSWEPFKNLKGKSKWLDIIKAQNLAVAPQSITFSTDMNRNYYELQERDLENPGDFSALPATFSQNWTWNRNFSLKWDIFKALHFTFTSGTKAEIEEPYTQINKDLYPDRYEAWKDSVKWSLRHFGRPLDYTQNTQISYKLPLEKIPVFDWASVDGSYTANYSWKRGAERAGRPSLGNTINSQRTYNINGKIDLEKLYNHSKFLQEANKRFSASNAKTKASQKKAEKEREDKAKKAEKDKEKEARQKAEQESMETGESVDSIMSRGQKGITKQSNVAGVSTKKKTENKGFVQEITLYPDSDLVIAHGQKSKRVRVTARDSSGFAYNIKFKKVDENSIRIVKTPVDTTNVRLNVVALPKASEQKWYGLAQTAARFLMMVRNVSITYRNTYNLAVPGFLPDVGDMLGQKKLGGIFTPGLDYAFGFVNDSYLDKAKSRGWLLGSDSVATPATIANTKDLQVKMTLEPFTDVKIDLNMSRTDNRNKSIQYMYGTAPVHSGSFNMTTISIGSAFASPGSASNGYYNKTFQKFLRNLDVYQQRVEAQYLGRRYPEGTGMSGTFNPENGTVNKYSADVMVPAFLNAYTGSKGLDIFPSLLKMLPNWSINYKGLSNLPWVRDHFKSVNLTHSYKSVYAVGSFHSYSSWVECMGSGGLGFIQNTTTGSYVPNSLLDVSTVSINENFSPLIGINATLDNNMTVKLEYKTSRVLNLSMTSAQLTETGSKDFVLGWGYKINDFDISRLWRWRKASEEVAKNTRTPKGKGGANDLNDMDGGSRQTEGGNRGRNAGRQKVAHDLNLRFDFSIRNQNAIKRDLQTNLCEATSGSKAFKTSAQVDYTMSRMVTLSLFYDRQRSAPLLSSSSYPTITQDFGMTMKFSLTR
ncbi:MAG: cell surface protein SprA [Bacteroidaceae bacterium]|nr:cell surface protein SprA [Bacteroidaceae bacterium]